MTKYRLILFYACIALLFTGYLVCPALGVTITESPSAIDSGDTIHVNFAGLSDGASVSIGVNAQFEVLPASAFSLDMNNFVMPFSLKNGEMVVKTENTEYTDLNVVFVDHSISLIQNSKNGILTITKSGNISSQTYPQIKLAGKSLPNISEIKTSVVFVGTKSGAVDSELSFEVDGIENGLITIIIYVDGQETLNEPVVIGNYQIPSAGSPSTTGGYDGGSGDGSGGGSDSGSNDGSDSGTNIATDLDSLSNVISKETSTISSLDDSTSISGTNVDGITLLLAQTSAFPAEWKKIGSAYQLIPDRTISPDATLSFTLPAGGNGIYFIAEKSGGTWNMLPSEITQDTMVTEISKTGTYCLIQLNPPEIQDDTSSGTESVASNGPSSATTPAKESPISIILISGAFLSAMGLFALRINKK